MLHAVVLSSLAGCAKNVPPSPGAPASSAAPTAAPFSSEDADKSATRSAPVAVVELFTSEGCSSCPPADGVLRRLRAEGRSEVVLLAFHVDYWDSLGWPDPFASHDATARQERYARALGRRGLYTPQAVVGGVHDVLGSDEDAIRSAVARALEGTESVTARVASDVGGEVEVTFDPPRAELGGFVAWVEDGLVTKVPRGENAGRTLTHDAVVRRLKPFPRGGGHVALGAAPGDAARSRVVAVIEDAAGRAIGASVASVPTSR